jgi:hypothetical protein
MQIILRIAAVIAFGVATSGCATVALAPGAEQVRITNKAAEVASCKGVGNVKARFNSDQLKRQFVIRPWAWAPTRYSSQDMSAAPNRASATTVRRH